MDRVIEGPHSVEIVSESQARERPIAPADVADSLEDYLRDSETGEPLPVGECISTYLKFNKSLMNRDTDCSRYEYARYNQYPRILEADRQFQTSYDLTTVTFTRRLSPLNDSGELLTPWELSEQLHGGGVRGAIRSAIDYQLGDRDYNWVGVTSPRELSGTPEEHLHYWIDDPEDEITSNFFENARDRHLEYVSNALEENHRIREDGGGGTVQVDTDPDRGALPETNESLLSVIQQTEGEPARPTTSAHFVATQLPDLVVGDYYSHEDENPPDTLLEGAASGWIVPHRWFRTSDGVPGPEGFGCE